LKSLICLSSTWKVDVNQGVLFVSNNISLICFINIFYSSNEDES